MKLHLATRTLYGDDGVFVKALYCPLQKSGEQLHPEGSHKQRSCSDCARLVHDTAGMSDAERREFPRVAAPAYAHGIRDDELTVSDDFHDFGRRPMHELGPHLDRKW